MCAAKIAQYKKTSNVINIRRTIYMAILSFMFYLVSYRWILCKQNNYSWQTKKTIYKKLIYDNLCTFHGE